MRLPIYRHLNQRLEIFGLSPIELVILCVSFILLTEFLPRFPFVNFIVLMSCIGIAFFLRYLHRRFESRYIEKTVRFMTLPDRLERQLAQIVSSQSPTDKVTQKPLSLDREVKS